MNKNRLYQGREPEKIGEIPKILPGKGLCPLDTASGE